MLPIRCPALLTALQDAKASSPRAWRAAKQAVLQNACRIINKEEDQAVLTVTGFVHLVPGSPASQHAHHASAPTGHVSVEVAVDAASGEILDCRTSCCPGGFHAVLGSLCPCVSALLLHAAAAAEKSPGGLQVQAAAGSGQPCTVRCRFIFLQPVLRRACN